MTPTTLDKTLRSLQIVCAVAALCTLSGWLGDSWVWTGVPFIVAVMVIGVWRETF